MCQVDARDSFVLPTFAKGVFVVEQTKLFNDVVHYEVSVNLRFACYVFLIGFTQCVYLINVKPLVRVNFQHSHHQTP